MRRGRAGAAAVLAVVVVATALAAVAARTGAARPRCSADPKVAARYVVPPVPFVARVVSVVRIALPPGEPAGGGPQHKRLYRVTFDALRGNAVLPAGHRYTQFAYVARKTVSARWCFLKGGSGP